MQQSAPNGRGIFIGVVFNAGSTPETSEIVLVDPPLDDDGTWDLRELRFLKRSFFYWRLFRAVWRGNVALALANRLNALMSTAMSFKASDGLALVNASGLPFELGASFASVSFLVERRRTSIHGRIFPSEADRRRGLFIGFHRRVVEAVVEQNHSDVIDLAFVPTTISVGVRWRSGEMSGTLRLMKSGAVVGVLHGSEGIDLTDFKSPLRGYERSWKTRG